MLIFSNRSGLKMHVTLKHAFFSCVNTYILINNNYIDCLETKILFILHLIFSNLPMLFKKLIKDSTTLFWLRSIYLSIHLPACYLYPPLWSDIMSAWPAYGASECTTVSLPTTETDPSDQLMFPTPCYKVLHTTTYSSRKLWQCQSCPQKKHYC
jgi:hypothetical protein